jgi:hypothetical protein
MQYWGKRVWECLRTALESNMGPPNMDPQYGPQYGPPIWTPTMDLQYGHPYGPQI